MSMFCLGGIGMIVPNEMILPEMYEDRIFLPGIIHGSDDYLIRVYLNDGCDYTDEFVVEYLTKDLIINAHKEDPSNGDVFNEILIEEAENFGCYNDGDGEFSALIEEWPKAIIMSNSDLVNWAMKD